MAEHLDAKTEALFDLGVAKLRDREKLQSYIVKQ